MDERMVASFLADICENAQDMAPRLIFADWLDDNGQPEWAKGIREQIALHGNYRISSSVLDENAHWSSWPGQTSLEFAFPRLYEPVVCRALERTDFFRSGIGALKGWMFDRNSPGRLGIGVLCRRGFPEILHAEMDWLLSNLPRVVRQLPICEVIVTDREPAMFQESPGIWPAHVSWWKGDEDALEPLPSRVWDLLKGSEEITFLFTKTCKNYYTAEKAREALGQAMIDLAWAENPRRSVTPWQAPK